MDSGWGRLPQAFGPLDVVEQPKDDEDVVMGEAGERAASARTRARPSPPPAEGAAPIDGQAVEVVGPGALKKRRARNDTETVTRLLRKMAKDGHPHHKELEFCVQDEGRILCNACGSSFGHKSNVRTGHWASSSHKEAVAKARATAETARKKAAQKQQATINQGFAAAESAIAAKIVKDEATTEFRMRVLRMCCERGIPMDVIDGDFAEIFEEMRVRRFDLGHRSNLARDLMGNLRDQLFAELRAEHKDVQMALAFDSTPWNDDIAMVVSRVCTEDFVLRHRLVAVKSFASSLKASHWLRVIDDVIKELGVERCNVRIGLTDGCNTMVKTGRDLEEHLDRFVALRCLPHFWQKIPGKFVLENVTSLMAAWNAVFKNSGSARNVFKKITRKSWARKHKIRWNAAHVQCAQLLHNLSDLNAIVKMLKERGLCKSTVPALERLLQQGVSDTSELAQALAVHHDASLPFVKITKFLEGDGFLAPFVSQRILKARTFIQDLNRSVLPREDELPNVFKLFEKFGVAVNKEAKWGALKAKLQPAFQYVWDVLGEGLLDDENGKYFTGIYELASVFHPPSCLANLRRPTFVLTKLLEDVHVVRLLGKPLCASLAADYGKLTTACFPFKDDKFKPHTLLDWWRDHGRETGSWAAAARLFVLCQPNSELAERAGAILRARTSDQQGKQLDETFEVSSMLAFKYAETRKLAK
jgi:hypothetical protein